MAGPYVATVIIGLVAGIVGGTLSFFVWSMLPHVPAAQGPNTDAAGPGRFREFTLVDDSGHGRTLLCLVDGNITLLLTDEAMSWRCWLSVGSGGPFLRFIEKHVNSRLGIGILKDSSPGLELADASGKPRASLGLDESGTAFLTLRDRQGRVRGSLQVPAEGEPSFVLSDPDGSTLAKLP